MGQLRWASHRCSPQGQVQADHLWPQCSQAPYGGRRRSGSGWSGGGLSSSVIAVSGVRREQVSPGYVSQISLFSVRAFTFTVSMRHFAPRLGSFVM